MGNESEAVAIGEALSIVHETLKFIEASERDEELEIYSFRATITAKLLGALKKIKPYKDPRVGIAYDAIDSAIKSINAQNTSFVKQKLKEALFQLDAYLDLLAKDR